MESMKKKPRSDIKQRTEIEDYLSYLFISRLLQPVKNTDAYKSGLVDVTGKVIREPETDAEHAELTLLDKTIFHLKRIMQGKMQRLRDFAFIHLDEKEEVTDRLIFKGSVKDRAQINIVKKKIDKHLQEELGIEFSDFVQLQLLEEVRHVRKPS